MGTATIKKPTKVTGSAAQPLPYHLNLTGLADAKTVPTTDWAEALLTILKAPVTPNNIVSVTTWLHNEQSTSSWATDATNPLGVEDSSGKVQSQGNVLQGLLLTAAALKNYPTITSALKADAPTAVTSAAIVQSRWNTGKSGTGLYGGKTISQFIALGPLITTGSSNNSLLVQAEQGAAGSEVKDVANTVGGLSTIEGDLSSSAFWKRIGVFSLGVTLAIGGVVLFVVTSKTGTKTIDTAAKAV